jgi:hypothetical protein
MAHSPPDSLLRGDINEVVAAIAIVSTLDQDQALRRKLRRHADCPDDQPLNLELPVGSAGLQLRPDGSIHPVRAAEIQPATMSIKTLEEPPVAVISFSPRLTARRLVG